QEEIARLESEIGQFRERANQALVDLQDARNLSEQARRGTVAARGALDDAQLDVESAQEKLDEISRSAYRRANTSESVTAAAGGDAREKMLARQSFLRSQAEKQQGTVTELERVRTEKSNKESQLRKAEQLAVEREANAEAAEDEARSVLEENQNRVSEVSAEHEELVALQQEAQAALSSARTGEAPVSADSVPADPAKEAAKEPEEPEETTAPESADQDAAAPRETSSETVEDKNDDAGADAAESTQASEPSSTQNYAAPAPAESDNSQGSSVDGQQAAQLAGLAVGAAAAIVAAS